MNYFSKFSLLLLLFVLLQPEAFAVKVKRFPSDTPVEVPATTGSFVAGNCVKVAADGKSVTDAGAACGTSTGAPVDAQYYVAALHADLSAEIVPAANIQSILGAANYAAVRGLLDLEAGTDFYSIAGADAAFQPLEATLTDIADGTIAENLVNTANPWADNEVADNITASSYLPLAGGVLTGEVTVDDLGLEFTPGDALTDCSTYSATGGGLFYDDSEGKFKKCQDNTLTDLDTGGAETNSLEVLTTGIATTEIPIGTAANTVVYAALGGDVTMTNAGVVTISDNSVDGTDIALGSDAAGDVMYYDGTNWVRLAKGTAGQVLEMNAGATAPEWDADDGGTDTLAPHVMCWPGVGGLPVEHGADSIPPISKEAGTNVDVLTANFDSATDECTTVFGKAHTKINTAANANLYWYWYADTAPAGCGTACEAVWDFRAIGNADDESWDTALSTTTVTDSTSVTDKDVMIATTTLAMSTYAANDLIIGEICRDANNAADDLAGDTNLIMFCMEVPLAP